MAFCSRGLGEAKAGTQSIRPAKAMSRTRRIGFPPDEEKREDRSFFAWM